MGWLKRMDDGYVTARDAATLLGMSVTNTRRLLGAQIPAVQTRIGWRVAVDDVLAFRDRFAGSYMLADIAEAAGVSYAIAHRTIRRLEISAAWDEHTRTYVLTQEQPTPLVRTARCSRSAGTRAAGCRSRACPFRTFDPPGLVGAGRRLQG
jgi:hypothetical protein